MSSETATQPAVESTPLHLLKPAAWNPRKIRDERFQNLVQSIQADPGFLWRRPVLAMADGTIYAGNMRYRAAEHLGLGTIPAIREDIPEQLAKERALRDNAAWGEWVEEDLASMLEELRINGTAMDLLGFDERELQKLLNTLDLQGGLTDPDAIPELPEEPVTQPGDLYLLGPHRVLCGDSTNPEHVAFLMHGEKARLMATDPPYLVDYTGRNHPKSKASTNPDGSQRASANKNWDEYRDPESSVQFYVDFIEAALPHLEDKVPVYQWHAHRRQSFVEAAWQKTGLLFHQEIIWVKTRGVLTRSHFMWQHEPCMYGWQTGKQPKLKPPANETTVWHVDQKGEQDGIHPTQKPVELFKRPLLYHTKPGELCYEPFLGSGTCLIAAETTNRRCFGMEQEPAYVDVVVARWERFTGRKAKRIAGGGER